MPLDRPIPAFYCCYLLRSTVSRVSVYVGSTPNPVRRLRQHNGLAKGGAVRTARTSLRPWEMTCIVTGFPSHIAALQFEWAWQNPHITLHIAPEERLQHATQKKRSGHPKRPRHSVSSLLSNLHLLLRSPSFSRWPLEIRFFSKTVHNAWVRWTKAAPDPIPDTIRIIKDFSEGTGKGSDVEDAEAGTANAKIYRRMAYLPVDYDIKKSHVEKAKDIIDFEREGSCSICKKDLKHDGGLYTVCPGTGCETVTHMACLSKHFIAEQDQDELVPISGKCPSCDIELIWVELVKELTLRMRGQKEVQNLLKVKRVKKGKASELSQTVANSSDMEQESDDDLDIDEDIDMKDFATQSKEAPPGDSWHIANETDASDAESVASTSSLSKKKKPSPTRKSRPAPARRQIVEDSDWDEAEILD